MRDTVGGSTLLLAAYYNTRRDSQLRFLPRQEDIAQFIFVGLLGVWGAQVRFFHMSCTLAF
jgi:hypothetical protein